MAERIVTIDQIDTATACILQVKAIAALAAELPVDGDFPDDALRNSMWAVRGLLDKALQAIAAPSVTEV